MDTYRSNAQRRNRGIPRVRIENRQSIRQWNELHAGKGTSRVGRLPHPAPCCTKVDRISCNVGRINRNRYNSTSDISECGRSDLIWAQRLPCRCQARGLGLRKHSCLLLPCGIHRLCTKHIPHQPPGLLKNGGSGPVVIESSRRARWRASFTSQPRRFGAEYARPTASSTTKLKTAKKGNDACPALYRSAHQENRAS